MKKKLVVIATWNGIYTLNYGSTLQAIALQELIRECGYNAITIDFRYQGKRKNVKSWIAYEKKMLKKGTFYCKMKYKYDRYLRKNMKMSSVCFCYDEVYKIAKKADILLAGSDAIWCEHWMKQAWIRPLFTWQIDGLENISKISYAPAFLEGEVRTELVQALKHYSSISVREKYGKKLLQETAGIVAEYVLDPVLTVDEEFWQKKRKKTDKKIKEKYLLAYIVSEAAIHRISIEKIKKKFGLNKVIYINVNCVDKNFGSTYYYGEDYPHIIDCGTFLTLINNAEVVCTDSYHGMLTSIVFRKDFFIFDRNLDWSIDSDYRFTDVTERLGIGNRIIKTNNEINEMGAINWNNVEKNLIEERKKSKKFLADALKS